ncbi:MAG: flagellar biosynthetic protein FliO [Treponema sp.]|nr:flagellar biosynthetic protein FliO [Treponema sp.]
MTLFVLMPSFGLWAQDAEPEVQAPDAHTLVERNIPLGQTANPAGGQQAVSLGSIVRVVLTLLLVVLGVYFAAHFLKRSMRQRTGRDSFLKLLASAPLGTGRSVHVVSVGSKAWLVGSAEHGVNLIGELDDKETVDAMLLAESLKSSEESAGKLGDFRAILRRFGAAPAAPVPGPEDIRKRSERLKGI